jgi:hypothetical protein
MLIEFLGSPCSGKTNTAARLFEALKTHGLPTEFIPELARQYIIELRVSKRLPVTTPLSFSDEQQIEILRRQVQREDLYKRGCSSSTTIISDSSPFNTLAYITEKDREDIRLLTNEAYKLKPLIFWCRAVHPPLTKDLNRIHGFEESKRLDSEVFPALVEILRTRGLSVTELTGSREERYTRSLWCSMEHYESN